MTIKEHIYRQLPSSLVSRMLLLTLLSIATAQFISTSIWYNFSKDQELDGLKNTAEGMAQNIASTATFFNSLPLQYRHIVLEQLRDFGGSRYFVSLNEVEITIDPVENSEMKRVVLDEFQRVLGDKLGNNIVIKTEFSHPKTLHVLNNDTLLSDLPRSWAHYSLTLEPLNPPVLVIQMMLAPDEWLYIAALLPAPYVSLNDNLVSNEQLFFIFLITANLMWMIYVLVRWQTKPLKRLAAAAATLSQDLDQPPLAETGASELVIATKAFNRMHLRIKRYIDDRERLFRSISHDLKTPITRLRLRAELLNDDTKTAKFNKDLDQLEMMVKGALQCVKDTDIHENNEIIDIQELLYEITEHHNCHEEKVTFEFPNIAIQYPGKPLAIKRCLTNLVENAIKYGDFLHLIVEQQQEHIVICLIDSGPGIPENMLEDIFTPYTRIAQDTDGSGLGLSIARNIASAHGGTLTLHNRENSGLKVILRLPHKPSSRALS
ncbi:ATP-binding protein [Moritella sp. F3]|uniref:ATP-binding protein n=1 Tax=Moritella sp. F3 TaxID=2718882 RepID=UPI0018E10591|nr:ATP-binding protein [Moritella sp. F3]GIC78926.1 two-component sensor histidine kinase [Moritella sp. F1]GIC83985.1 two-component sensor histidine kinase [Moritella sp. F3]